MRYLFDTHTYLWFRGAPKRLPVRVADLLSDMTHQGLISVVTPWEISVKTGSGKLEGRAVLKDFEARETGEGFVIAPVTIPQAIQSGLLPRHHGDPFDRLLVAQALELSIPIVSNDQVFDLYGVQRLWN